ncbi:uncharacterized protein LOC130818616 [Amaranthus tricolor]|uniref:uncharacterized protein LOC130818616 n=1 Tax=Amaranthus tricolor TaxID=29722 RepID=UPI0025910E37|nr:uncharacterized protein LOC130818616 [Amaranthus tricolor]
MEKLGFDRRWIRWIMNCVTSASMSILLNGSPLKPFKIVSEALVCLLEKADDMNLIEAIHIDKEKLSLKHLQFADDTLIFAPRNSMARDTSRCVGCLHSTCPFTYLGFPLGDHMNKCSAWKPVVEKIQNRLASWKAKILSRAGRLTLIKSVLNSLPVYYMSLFKMSKAIALKIFKLRRRFF